MSDSILPEQLMESIKKAESYAIKKYNEIKEHPTIACYFIMETFMQTFIKEFTLNVVMANNFNANDKEKGDCRLDKVRSLIDSLNKEFYWADCQWIILRKLYLAFSKKHLTIRMVIGSSSMGFPFLPQGEELC